MMIMIAATKIIFSSPSYLQVQTIFNEEEKIYFLLLFLLLLQSECRIFLLKFTYCYGYVAAQNNKDERKCFFLF